jgi:hypothetical protein
MMRFAINSSTEYNINWFNFTLAYPRADINRDGVVNATDLSVFATCIAGPGVTTRPPGCTADQFARSDFDTDADVDLADYATFQALHTE